MPGRAWSGWAEPGRAGAGKGVAGTAWLCGASAPASRTDGMAAVATVRVQGSRHTLRRCAACRAVCRTTRWRVASRSAVAGAVSQGVVAVDAFADLGGAGRDKLRTGRDVANQAAGGYGRAVAGRGGRDRVWREERRAGRDGSLRDGANRTPAQH